jgi:prepilin-type N-terminal cleavage/methylation domain-containing protein
MSIRQRGFTLFESLVAMTLMAMLLGALLSIFQGGMSSLRFGADQTRATLMAQAQLTRALVVQSGPQLVPPESGETGGMQWQIQRHPYVETQLPGFIDEESSEPLLWEISVRVKWDDQHSLTLKGLTPVKTLASDSGGAT